MHSSLRHIIILVFICLMVAVGCGERTIDAFEDEGSTFSIYGALDINSSTQNLNTIRVRRLDVPFFSDDAINLNATVTLSDLQTGEQLSLKDSLVTFDGNITHNFIVEDELKFDSQYRISVVRDDGLETSSIATTPQLTSFRFTPDTAAGIVDGQEPPIFCETFIHFEFLNVRSPEFIQMSVGVEHNGSMKWADVEIVGRLRFMVGADGMFVRLRPRNLLVEVFPPRLPDNPFFDRFLLRPTVGCNNLDSPEFQIRFRHFGPEWASASPRTGPSSGFDTPFGWPIQFETGAIENGIGFFGTYYEEQFSFSITR